MQRASWNHYLKAYGRHTEWVSFADVDEYFQLNETYAAALEAGTATLVDVLEAEARTATEVGFSAKSMFPCVTAARRTECVGTQTVGKLPHLGPCL